MIDPLCWLVCAKVIIHETKISKNQPQPVPIVYEVKPSPKINTDTSKNNRVAGGDGTTAKATSNVYSYPVVTVTASNKPVIDSLRRNFGNEADLAIELFRRESGLRPNAINSRSGAAGLVQALPRTKLPCNLTYDPTDIECQVKWGRDYVTRRYGSTANALAFHTRNGYY